MVVQRRPKLTESAVEAAAQKAFIDAAPDAKPKSGKSQTYEKGIAKGNKRQITLTIAPELLRSVDEIAARSGQTRAAVINMAIFRSIQGDIFKAP
ncbi:CopG family transcriptional regulator [Sphingomonas corticis]|uniref:CopG family transcriptional regulator n=1 Tax=Sphingomonas corticis TaxID=2722791 RepID=A0ABX1CWQ9_9SPHN|nr:CopG family transcriptional regulator [Sphingomonas corticis]NJR80842.1 CopG family transcriptional regulator [Sphingomonas corticis]